ncbi:uncharacterized protein DNG_04459 [Cephalotrichum gorgonifer]|uniref:NACHT domain-containing protein n=1 Tax=Cephalotrichum gorgonifer TaxID=2041049 RepID=A0AAE8SUK6_9PEZI|nr:uncharacterized protein DNG_04459 [Cephalotrichum gorgonifer]
MSSSDPTLGGSASDSDAVVVHPDDVSTYNPEQILPSPPKDIEAIRSWLHPTLYDSAGGEYRKHLASHVEGTGTWLTSSKTYQEWLHGTEHGLLWIKGIPGSGKSVVAANLIRELARSNPGSPVLFFFFRQIIDANHDPQALLRDWMDQLLEYSPPLQMQLMAYVKEGRSITTLSMEDLWKDLSHALTRLPGKVFCIGDALDEIDQDRGHDVFLRALGSLGQLRPLTVKVLITSRPVPRVEIPLRTIPGLCIRLEEALVDVDISTYVHFALSTSTFPIQQSDRKIIENAVPGRANGLFLYAKLAMDAFLEPNADIATVLSRLPADLNALYTDLLEEHSQRSGIATEVQRLILQSVTHATRPLRLLELAEMIRVCSPDRRSSVGEDEKPMESTRDLKATKELIRAACGPLLEILAVWVSSVDADAEEGDYMGGASIDGAWVPGGHNVTEGESKLRLRYPFYDYAASNWAGHIRASEAAGYDQTRVNAELAKFLGRVDTFEGWLANRWMRRYDSSNPVTQLHVAANGGLVSYTKELLQDGEGVVDARDAGGRTPLWLAAAEGHAAVIRELIAAGANPNERCTVGGLTPLHKAAGRNYFEAASALIYAGADPLAPKKYLDDIRSIEDSPLGLASRQGHLETVNIFLPFLEDLTAVHHALSSAAKAGQAKVVARILEYPGVDVNSKIRGKTALFLACGCPDAETVRILLQAGADPNINREDRPHDIQVTHRTRRPGWGNATFNCMHQLCGSAAGIEDEGAPEVQREIFSLLIQAGTGIHQRCISGMTPLHYAANTSVTLIRLLLDAGADPNAADNYGQTPIYKARTIDNEGNGPLHSLLQTSYPSMWTMAGLLLGVANAEPNLKNHDGLTPLLSLEDYSEHIQEAVDMLLEAGADIDAIDRDEPRLARFNFILGLGLDVTAKDCRGNGLLHELALLKGNHGRKNRWYSVTWLIPVWKKLVDRGLDLHRSNYAGRTPLHILCATSNIHPGGPGDMMPIDFVLSKTKNVDQTDKDGNTALHIAAAAGEKEIYVKKLLEAGADPTAVTHEGLTALHLASRFRSPNIVGLLLDALRRRQYVNVGRSDIQGKDSATATPEPVNGVNVGAFERPEITPLHYACRSGRPETVALLLEAGADVSCSDVFQACSEFDEEDDLWGNTHASEDCEWNGDAVALKLDDKSRRKSPKNKSWTKIQHIKRGFGQIGAHDTARLAEILDMFARHGAHLPKPDCPPGIHSVLGTDVWTPGFPLRIGDAALRATKPRYGYASACLMEFQRRELDTIEVEVPKQPPSFSELMHQSIQEASIRTLRDFKPLEAHVQHLFHRFILQREYHLVEELARLGISFLPDPELDSVSLIAHLIRHGFYSLFESIGSAQAESQLEGGSWHAFGNTLQPGLWCARRDLAEPRHSGYRPVPFILEAVWRSLPNMEVLRLLVEKFKVDINEVYYTRQCINNHYAMDRDGRAVDFYRYDTIPNDSALHSLAVGKACWHTYQALPYLIKAGAHLEIRDQKGRTPLHIALNPEEQDRGTFSREAATVLVAAGADVNAVSDDGRSCLARAGDDIVMVKLLISHGASVTADALFAAIEAANAPILQALLSGGASPNMRRDPPPPDDEDALEVDGSGHRRRWRDPFGTRGGRRGRGSRGNRGRLLDGVMLHEEFPLYRAAQTESRLAQILMDHGADPFAKFLRVVNHAKTHIQAAASSDALPEGHEECTVLHRLLVSKWPDNTVVSRRLNEDTMNTTSDAQDAGDGSDSCTTVFQHLISLGADIRARDNCGRNVVHHMIGRSRSQKKMERLEKSLAEALALAPELINQADSYGQTPLFYAVSTIVHPRVKLVKALLSAGADPLAVDGSGDTVLHYLTRDLNTPGIRALFKDLINRGVDINTQNSRGETPLFAYCVRPRPSSGASFSDYFYECETEPLISETDARSMLADLGADFFARDKKGRGLLHVAASGRVERFMELMGLGLDPMLEDEVQQTAIDVAAACGNTDILALFEKNDGARQSGQSDWED